MNDIFIHYGSSVYYPMKVRPVKNSSCRNKPTGGFWMSPIESLLGWKDWCIIENFNCEKLSESFQLKFREYSKIFIINNLVDLNKLPTFIHYNKYAQINDEFIDFEKISQGYDAIWLTAKGEVSTCWITSRPSLYGWDCESVLVFNRDCIYQI